MRRRPGISGLKQEQQALSAYKDVGRQLQQQRLDTMREQMKTFKDSLEEFALKYRKEIRSNPTFRAQFHTMCGNIGVDPLASNKGMWTTMLGIGDFYYELAVQTVEACMATRNMNGGMLELSMLLKHVTRRRGSKADPISDDDISRAIKKLKALGNGFDVITVGNRKLVRSVPGELNLDKNKVLSIAEERGYISAVMLKQQIGWDDLRIANTLEELLKEGFAMIDLGAADGVALYWFPCFGLDVQ